MTKLFHATRAKQAKQNRTAKHTKKSGQARCGGRKKGPHADQYVFQCPGEWDRWFYVLLTEGSPTHAMLGLLRRSYGARVDGFRLLRRRDIQLTECVEESKILLRPQKGWNKSSWEPMTTEVHTALHLATKGISAERTEQLTPTEGGCHTLFHFHAAAS